MAVALTNTTSAYQSIEQLTATTTVSAVTRASGEGFVLGMQWYLGTNDPTITWDPSGDNQNFTKLGATIVGSSDSNNRIAWFYLAAPTSVKTGNIRITYPGADQYYTLIAIRHVTGHDTTTMIRGDAYEVVQGTIAGSTPISDTIPSGTDDLCIDFALFRASPGLMNPESGQTNSVTMDTGSAINAKSTVKAGASSVTMGWTHPSGTSDGWYLIETLLSVQASSGGGSSANVTNCVRFHHA